MDITFMESGKIRKGILVNCKICNKEFSTRKNKPNICCSQECGYTYRRNRVEVTCRQCETLFEKQVSKLGKSKSGLHFCSRKCKDEAQRIGGVQEIMPPHYGTSEGRESYKNFIKNSEHAICSGCGESKVYLLCIHHIDGNHENNVEENFEIVCWNCHAKRHLKFDENKGAWIYSCRSLTPRDKLIEL